MCFSLQLWSIYLISEVWTTLYLLLHLLYLSGLRPSTLRDDHEQKSKIHVFGFESLFLYLFCPEWLNWWILRLKLSWKLIKEQTAQIQVFLLRKLVFVCFSIQNCIFAVFLRLKLSWKLNKTQTAQIQIFLFWKLVFVSFSMQNGLFIGFFCKAKLEAWWGTNCTKSSFLALKTNFCIFSIDYD